VKIFAHEAGSGAESGARREARGNPGGAIHSRGSPWDWEPGTIRPRSAPDFGPLVPFYWMSL